MVQEGFHSMSTHHEYSVGSQHRHEAKSRPRFWKELCRGWSIQHRWPITVNSDHRCYHGNEAADTDPGTPTVLCQ
jgi:hypothetical protein